MLKHLADFDINEVGCSCAFDREFIFGSIARWHLDFNLVQRVQLACSFLLRRSSAMVCSSLVR